MTAACVALTLSICSLAAAAEAPAGAPAAAAPASAPAEAAPAAVRTLKAQGFGAAAKGGAGGRVIPVTTLNDSGPGSLREALQAEGRRTIVFRTGGTIRLTKPLRIDGAKGLTVDGLTAAAYGGITIAGGGMVIERSEDVILRHIRCRGGYDPLSVLTSTRVLVDHVSTAWATDENLSAWAARDVTFQWCIIAEGLVEGGHEDGPHSMGSLQAGGANRVTTHHCLFTGNLDRNPLVGAPTRPGQAGGSRPPWRFDVVNNVVYNYWNAAKTGGAVQVNLIGNVFRLGPDSSPAKAEILLSPADRAKVYCRGNFGPHRRSDGQGQHDLLLIYAPDNRKDSRFGLYAPAASRYVSEKPLPTPAAARVTCQVAAEAYELVLQHAGAWPRDKTDQRLVEEVRRRKGAIGRVGPRWRKILRAYQEGKNGDRRRSAAPVRCDTRSAKGPLVLPWKSLSPDPAYHGQWLVAGDLDGDGVAEIVTARNRRQCVTAAAACRLDGTVLWRWGQPDAGSPGLSYDVPLQLYDLDGDGRPEVYLSIKGFLLVLDGRTGKELRRLPLPDGLDVADCITFVNLRGRRRARDILVKDRYRCLWAYTDGWKCLWRWRSPRYRTCHHPTPVDIDADGRDEIIAGYTLLDDDGRELWTLTSDKIKLARGHVDCSEVMKAARRPEDSRLLFTCCGACGIALADGAGKVLWEVAGHHFESADFGPIRKDCAGDEIVVDIDHLPFGKSRVWLLDSRGRLLVDFHCDYGRHHRLIDWNGDGLMEILVGNTRKLLDGTGKCVAHFGPAGAFADGSAPRKGFDPTPFAAVGDLDGDRRPEVILHSTKAVHIYKSDRAAKAASRPVGTGVNFTLY